MISDTEGIVFYHLKEDFKMAGELADLGIELKISYKYSQTWRNLCFNILLFTYACDVAGGHKI